MNLNNPAGRVGIDRRTCLKGALCSLPALLWANALGNVTAKTIAPNPFDTPSQNILVGYIPSEIVDAGPSKL